MKTVFFDLQSGAAGDMVLSALIDAGASLDYITPFLERMELPGLDISVEKVKRSGIACSYMQITSDTETTYRHLPQIKEKIEMAQLPEKVKTNALAVFNSIAEAEADAHNIPIEKVHFHEIGAVDTLVDIVGSCLALHNLAIDEITYGDLTIGHGTITAAHGTMPVPVPATSYLIQNFRIRQIDIETEILTPTGAALLTTLGKQVPVMTSGTLLKTGYGAGKKEFTHHTNCIRALIIETKDSSINNTDTVVVIESDMDHISGEIMAYAAEECLNRGALDVSWTPVIMKKGRPGNRLTVLCHESDKEILVDTIMRETRTLGIRYKLMHRITAERHTQKSTFLGEAIEEKKCTLSGGSFTKLEYETLAALARKTQRPILDILHEYEQKKENISKTDAGKV